MRSCPTRGGLQVSLRDDHPAGLRSEEHTSELQSQSNLVCRLLLEKKNRLGAWQGAVRSQEALPVYVNVATKGAYRRSHACYQATPREANCGPRSDLSASAHGISP